MVVLLGVYKYKKSIALSDKNNMPPNITLNTIATMLCSLRIATTTNTREAKESGYDSDANIAYNNDGSDVFPASIKNKISTTHATIAVTSDNIA